MIEQSKLLFGIMVPLIFVIAMTTFFYIEHKRSRRCTVFRLPLVVMDLMFFSYGCAFAIYLSANYNAAFNVSILFLAFYMFVYRYKNWEYLPNHKNM